MNDYILEFKLDLVFDSESLLSSPIFLTIIDGSLKDLNDRDHPLFDQIINTFGSEDPVAGILAFLKRLLHEDYRDIVSSYLPFTDNRTQVIDFIDEIYNHWRTRERYAFVEKEGVDSAARFLALVERFNSIVLITYRAIYENILNRSQTVYRQLTSGVNAGFLLSSHVEVQLPDSLSFAKKTRALESLVFRPPFICSSVENTRVGLFYEKNVPLTEEGFNPNDFVLTFIRVQEDIGYVYIHKDYLSFLVGLGNLFSIAPPEMAADAKPSFIVFFGASIPDKLTYYYEQEGIYVGLVPLKGHIAYFGYLKKIILTLHNLKQIEEGRLPIHGAGVEITLNDGKVFNVVILGDSGAGKSETIEALRQISEGRVRNVSTIFDDMGTFLKKEDGSVHCLGTETGAFVRLDDLEKGYSLQNADRAVYINIDRVNARLIIPVETLKMTRTCHHVDVFLLADNFTDTDEGLRRFLDKDEAVTEFIKGERVAQGTTSENGQVSTFFANPFGPLQEQEKTRPIIESVMEALFKEGSYVGRLFTGISIDPECGPKRSAKLMLQMLNELAEIHQESQKPCK